ncbi:MAG: hypothetical protein LBQ43_01335 [Holosporales bacterium]|nr:hypothetical protein [Holosporales bacterium]
MSKEKIKKQPLWNATREKVMKDEFGESIPLVPYFYFNAKNNGMKHLLFAFARYKFA